MPTLSRNNSGFTLTEVMVAIVVMMVGMLGLLQSINIATEVNLRNHLRDEAVYLAEKNLNILRGKPFDLLSTAYGVRYEQSKVRGSSRPYRVEMTAASLSTDDKTPAKQLQVIVKWTYKGAEYQSRVSAPTSTIK